MDHIDLNFLFHDHDHPDRVFSNNQLYEIRREVSRMMEEAGFGAQMENGPEKFGNTWAIPIDDTFFLPENHLFIAFTWRAPLAHGDLTTLVREGIPRLTEFVHANFDIRVLSRLIFD